MEQGSGAGEIAIFEAETGEIRVQVQEESVWLSQRQMAEVFDTSTDNISLHLKNIFADGEMTEEATTEDFSVVRQEGQRRVRRRVRHYNLDAILAVGYRVSSGRAIQFRKWATQILREHLTRGYTINRQRFEENARELEAALQLVRKASAAPALDAQAGQGLVEILSHYTQTFLWLQRYDEGMLQEPSGQAGGNLPTADEAMGTLNELKADLMAREEATELFAQPRGDGLASILGNLDQSAFGEPAYPSVEAKAAHLLYFVVKDHPFTDGNSVAAPSCSWIFCTATTGS
ncbi:MAG: virulence protein RhuM/Fic/DOC family protein [Desulfovermiculus sp.]|nr:virulence protein RhuM/Fic/DOC family protein [Desulfovermiculus sp.]